MCEPTVIVLSAVSLAVRGKLMGASDFVSVPGTHYELETTRRVTRNTISHQRFYDAHHPICPIHCIQCVYNTVYYLLTEDELRCAPS